MYSIYILMHIHGVLNKHTYIDTGCTQYTYLYRYRVYSIYIIIQIQGVLKYIIIQIQGVLKNILIQIQGILNIHTYIYVQGVLEMKNVS